MKIDIDTSARNISLHEHHECVKALRPAWPHSPLIFFFLPERSHETELRVVKGVNYPLHANTETLPHASVTFLFQSPVFDSGAWQLEYNFFKKTQVNSYPVNETGQMDAV